MPDDAHVRRGDREGVRDVTVGLVPAEASGSSNCTFCSESARFARVIRCAIVVSGTRNAVAISCVVRPPKSRSVSATRASAGSTGWHAMNTSRSRSSLTTSSGASSKLAETESSSPRAICSRLRSARRACRSASKARLRAAVISQAPGLSGILDSLQRESASTNASCASSSARSTLRISRTSIAISLGDSIRQIAAATRWTSGADMTPDQTTISLLRQRGSSSTSRSSA